MANYESNPDKITYFAETDYRSKRIKFGIRDEDRAKHMYIIGKTGMGKSTLLENLAIQDIQNGEGLCFIDPHGGTAETLLSYVPEDRINDVIYFAPFDQEFPIGLNVMEDMGRDKRPLVASGLMGAFKKVWVDAWSARMEYILNNAMLALMETPGSTLLGVNRIFADKNYRSMIVANITDPSVKAFWVDEYAKYSDKFATEATAAIQNKVGQFSANPIIRNMVGQPRSTFDIRDLMDNRKILIVNLSKGRMGEGNANLVGSMLITKIYLSAMSRADVGAEKVRDLPPFHLYVDEFQSFANESFADILSEARKYKLSLTIAHQYIEQMSDEVRAAVFGNVGTMISFRVGAYDAEVLEKEFAPAFTAEDLVNLGFTQVYLKLMIKGIGSPPFSAQTLDRPKLPPHHYAQEVIEASRKQFARPRAEVEEEIKKWHEPIPDPPRDPNDPIPETKKFPPGMRPVRPPVQGGGVPGAFGNQMRMNGGYYPNAYRMPGDQYPGAFPPQESYQGGGRRWGDQFSPPRIFPYQVQPSAPTGYTTGVEPVFPTPLAPGVPEKDQKQKEVAPPLPVKPPVVVSEQQGRSAEQDFHQPFRGELEKLGQPKANPQFPQKPSMDLPDKKTAQTVNPNRTPLSPKERVVPRVSLSSLKTEYKRDKGPSTENLTSLKSALEAVLTKAKKDDVQAPPSGAPTEGIPPPRRPVPPPQQKTETQEPRVLLSDEFSPQKPREVPEDVLRGVLAD